MDQHHHGTDIFLWPTREPVDILRLSRRQHLARDVATPQLDSAKGVLARVADVQEPILVLVLEVDVAHERPGGR